MMQYIALNTEKRKEETMRGTDAAKDLFKLFNNAVYGKTMENLRKRIHFGVVTSRKVAMKRIAKPSFKRAKIFREDLVGVYMAKPVFVMNRLIQVSFAILDLSKYPMYDFHYNTWMKKFPNSRLLFTDTDSLAYKVVGHDLYAGMAEIKDEFDFSEYPKDHFLQLYDNMKVVGKFKVEWKIECKSGVAKQIWKPTDTSVTGIVLEDKNTAKGVKASVANKLLFDNYEYCLSSLSPKRVDI